MVFQTKIYMYSYSLLICISHTYDNSCNKELARLYVMQNYAEVSVSSVLLSYFLGIPWEAAIAVSAHTLQAEHAYQHQ